jgi:DNA-binding NtrC family response regulator
MIFVGTKFASATAGLSVTCQWRLAMQIGVETSRLVENKRVFVVDDDEISRTVLQFMLQDDNETHEFATLAAAYSKGADSRPDVVLLGVTVVEAADPGLCHALKAKWPNVRILLITPPGQEAVAQSYVKDGAHGVLSAPFTVETVRRKVDIQLGRIQPALVQLQLVS